MAKRHFVFKLVPPRSTFVDDMTDTERQLMLTNVEYTRERFEAGEVLLFGPVRGPEGAFGVAILEVDDETAARTIAEADPSVRAGLNAFEIYPMRVAHAQGGRA